MKDLIPLRYLYSFDLNSSVVSKRTIVLPFTREIIIIQIDQINDRFINDQINEQLIGSS